MTTPSARATCWAASVSPCAGKRSLEHYITRGLWMSTSVTVAGLPHSPGPTQMRIDDLGTKCLCEKHNAELSPLDQAAIDLNNALRRLEELRAVRSQIRTAPTRPIKLRVDGRLIERWALKTVVNFCMLFRSNLGSWTPPAWLPDVVFGKRLLDVGCGLALMTKVGDQNQPKDEIKFAFGTRTGADGPEVSIITIRGGSMPFVASWNVPIQKIAMAIDGEDYIGSTDALMPPRRVNMNHGHRNLKLALIFDWSTSPKPDAQVVKLRKVYASPKRT